MTPKSLNFLTWLAAAILVTACNTMKKKCEKTNWNQHGKNVAMSGKWLNEDPFVKQCEKAEAKIDYSALDVGYKSGRSQYCEPDIVYKTGKEGKRFNGSMCDDGTLEKLKKRHAEGVAEFCKPENAFRVAAQGWKYNGICPKSLEKAFMREYYKGRKVYLSGVIDEKNKQVSTIDQELNELRSRKTSFENQLRSLPVPPPKPLVKAGQKPAQEDVKIVRLRQQREVLEDDKKKASRSISKLIAQKRVLNREIAALKRERNSIR